MAELVPLIDNSVVEDDGLGTRMDNAWERMSEYQLGQIHDGNSRPNVARRLFVSKHDSGGVNAALDEIAAMTPTRADRDVVVIELGPGTFDATKLKFSGFTDVHIVAQVPRQTVIECSPSAQGSDPDFWPGSLNFSDNKRCVLSGLWVYFDDDDAGLVSVAQAAITRSTNSVANGLEECIFDNCRIEVGEMHASRTGAANAMIFGVDTISTASTGIWHLAMRDCDIISSCGGVRIGGGSQRFKNTDIWYGNTARTGALPNLIGMDHAWTGRWYYEGGQVTTGYEATDPFTTNAVYGIRCNQAQSGSRGFLWNAKIFARNVEQTSPGNTRAIYMNGSTSSSNPPWIRAANCYLQAEHDANFFKDPEAVETDWDPHTDGNGGNRLELYNCRVAGVRGNVLGPDGRKVVSSTISMSSHWLMGVTLADTTSADFTLTLHTNDPVSNEWGWIKNYKGANDLTIGVASGDYLDGTVDGTLVVPPGGAVMVKCHDRDGSDKLYFETLNGNFHVWHETARMGIGGEVISSQAMPRWFFHEEANTTSELVGIKYFHETSGATFTFDVELEGSTVGGLTSLSCTNSETYTAATTPQALSDGDQARVASISVTAGTPATASFGLVIKHTVITKGA